jgi:hypothetical protein
MNIPLLSQLAHLIEEILKSDVPVVERAATDAAVKSIEQDPKVQAVQTASIALLQAAKDLKAAANTPTH